MFYGYDTKTQATNEKIDKFNFMEILKICVSKGTIYRKKAAIYLIKNEYPEYIISERT